MFMMYTLIIAINSWYVTMHAIRYYARQSNVKIHNFPHLHIQLKTQHFMLLLFLVTLCCGVAWRSNSCELNKNVVFGGLFVVVVVVVMFKVRYPMWPACHTHTHTRPHTHAKKIYPRQKFEQFEKMSRLSSFASFVTGVENFSLVLGARFGEGGVAILLYFLFFFGGVDGFNRNCYSRGGMVGFFRMVWWDV